MDTWEHFDEISIPDKKEFYSRLNIETITDIDYCHAKKMYKEFSNKNLGDYYNLYVQGDTLLLADVFENIKIYELDPTHFLSAPVLARQACLKKTEIKLKLLTDINMLLMVEKGISGGICHAAHRYVKANNKYMKNDNLKKL